MGFGKTLLLMWSLKDGPGLSLIVAPKGVCPVGSVRLREHRM
jgi:hypothetical protein